MSWRGIGRLCARLWLGACAVSISNPMWAEDAGPLLLHDPAVSRTRIAFSYAGDIWVATREGTDLRPVTSGGHERKPIFSPDGFQIAFTAHYDGGNAVYVIPAGGGIPKRLTYNPEDLEAVGWTPDGTRVLFISGRTSFAPYADEIMQLFTVPAAGGVATQVPLVRASEGSYSRDGSAIAYVPNVQWQHAQDAWKHYRGGQTQPIWIARLADSTVEAKIPRDNSNDFNPMWVGDTIYFLSDRSGPVTLFSYNTSTRRVTELIKNNGFDIKSAAATADAIVYEQFGSLHLFNIGSGEQRPIDLRPTTDLPQVRAHFQKIELAELGPATISPTGVRAAFAVHGEILTVPAEKGDIRNLTRTAGVVEREPAWAPDGKAIAYFSDESGEYALHIRDQSGLGQNRKIELGHETNYYYSPGWSPDSAKIAYTDKRLNYWYVDLKKKTPVKIDTDLYTDPTGVSTNPAHGLQLAWSPDSRWIAYTKQLQNHFHAVFIYSLAQAKSYQVTDGMSDAYYAAFDPTGKYLYFTASTDVGPAASWMDMSSLSGAITRNVYLVVLRKSFVSPLLPESDEEGARGSSDAAGVKSEGEMSIDFQGIGQRILPLPIHASNYYGLSVGKPGVIFLLEGPLVDTSWGKGEKVATDVVRFDLKRRKAEKLVEGITFFRSYVKDAGTSFHVSFNGEKMLYAKNDQWFVASTAPPLNEHPLGLDSMEIYVEPRLEWRHIYEQVWRDERDFFYDPNLHGVDVESLRKSYAPYLEKISCRDDLSYIFDDMLGHMSVSHLFVDDVEVPQSDLQKVGLLGADYAIDSGHYRFVRVYQGESWHPELRAPLTEPGVNVESGDYLLEVNGREVQPTNDVYSYFVGTVGKQIRLKVGSRADGADSREVTVVPIGSEMPLRHFAWVEDNRRKVDRLTGGRVAYIYLPNTWADGYMAFRRYYFAQVGKEAAIIDERFNHGGLAADYIIDYMRRPLMGFWDMREGRDITSPLEAIFGPKVLLVNEMSGSGGDLLAWMFRKSGIGPLIGERTWGGLVGHYAHPNDLMDGVYVGTPNLAFYTPNHAWEVENSGVSPDIEVEYDPKAARLGHDPQLEKAIAVVMEMLRNSPAPPTPQHPPFPRYPDVTGPILSEKGR